MYLVILLNPETESMVSHGFKLEEIFGSRQEDGTCFYIFDELDNQQITIENYPTGKMETPADSSKIWENGENFYRLHPLKTYKSERWLLYGICLPQTLD